jgi:hypothetical protein
LRFSARRGFPRWLIDSFFHSNAGDARPLIRRYGSGLWIVLPI